MKTMIALVAAALLAAPAGAETGTASGTEKWIVTFRPTVKRAGRDRALSALDMRASRHIATDGDSENEFSAAVVELPRGAQPSADSLSGELAGQVVSIERDVKLKWIESAAVSFQAAPLPSMAAVMESVGRFQPSRGGGAPRAGLAALAVRPELTWGVQRLRAPAAWQNTMGRGVRVAIIDTGIDTSHPDLVGQVDGGYSAITKSEAPTAYQDDNGHGTHVAGTVAAKRNDQGVVGVAPEARLYAVKVLDADGSGNLSDVIDGIVWAATNDMQVANMSLGAPFGSETMRRALRFATGRGTIVVAAAGNSGGSVGYPGAYPEAIAVSAADAEDKLAAFSSRGPEVDFIAPGVDVVSSKMGGGFASFSGTSMAAPHVAGVVALSVAQGWTGLNGPDGVLAQLRRASRPVAELTAEQQGAGMIDAGRLTR
ncbi:MAG: S8 family peptidase [Elusimicrobiota bacterium]|nr:S8 family peptidase [Elusimicrobiota bacterium]